MTPQECAWECAPQPSSTEPAVDESAVWVGAALLNHPAGRSLSWHSCHIGGLNAILEVMLEVSHNVPLPLDLVGATAYWF